MNKKHLWCGFLGLLFLAGCSRKPAEPEVVVEEKVVVPVVLADLLVKPRSELAEQCDEMVTRIQAQEKALKEGKIRYSIQPTLRLPLVVPVFRDAKFNAKAGFSLPPYVSEDSKDAELAVHLARFGDLEAAQKLIDPSDKGAMDRLAALKMEKNYPLEWTRLVALTIAEAESHLASGEPDAAKKIVDLHKQVKAALDDKAAKGLLGATLLPRGRGMLALAQGVWQKEQKTDVADMLKSELEAWGEAPNPINPVAGAPMSDVNRLFRGTKQGRTLTSVSKARAFDVLALPFPSDGAEAVVAGFDPKELLSEVLIAYRVKIGDSWPSPDHLAHWLEDYPGTGKDAPKATGMRSRTYEIGDIHCEVAVIAQGAGAGAIVRMRGKAGDAAALPRDFGAAGMDRSFEMNRVVLAPEQRGDVINATNPKSFARVRNPLEALKPALVQVQREPKTNVPTRLLLRYANTPGALLHQVAGPLWSTVGTGRLASAGEEGLEHLALIWEDAQTQYTLRMPYEESKQIEFEVVQRKDSVPLDKREALGIEVDRAERKQRFEARQPLSRIRRFVEQVELGMTRSQIENVLSTTPSMNIRSISGGLSFTLQGDPSGSTMYVPRQIFVRFNKANRAIELRGRYFDGPAAKTRGWMADILNELRKRSGSPEELPSTWAKLWDGMPEMKPGPVLYRWIDDVTILTYQRDSEAVELTVLDRPLEYENGIPLAPLTAVGRGPSRCLLGTKREDLYKTWKIAQPVKAGDAEVITPRGSELYDAYLIWFNDKDQVVRVTARHSVRPDPAKIGQELEQAYVRELQAREIETFGWPRRQDYAEAQRESMAWHDDVTRFRIFWERSTTGPPRIYTEWKELTAP